MKITDVAFIGYPVADMKRAKAFYEGVLGLKKSRGWGEYNGDEQWVEYDIGSGCLALITGAIDKWPAHPAGAAVALEVDDFEGYLKKVRDAGVKVVWEPQESPMCTMMVVADPDGSWVVLHKKRKMEKSERTVKAEA